MFDLFNVSSLLPPSLLSSTDIGIKTIDDSISPKEINSLSNHNKTNDLSSLYYYPSFFIVDPIYNTAGNYQNYVINSLTSILDIKKQIKDIKLTQNNDTKYKQNKNQKQKEKILVLDIDETLLYADFQERFKALGIYDCILNFDKPLTPEEENKLKLEQHLLKKINQLKNINLENKELEGKDVIKEIKQMNSTQINDNVNVKLPKVKVGVILRPGVKEFLFRLSLNYEISIYTASHYNYAKAVADYLDPKHQIFNQIFSRNDCLNLDNQIYIKNLDIFPSIKKVILLDNSMYSFMNHISNGILINSFFGDKKDNELMNVLKYLEERVLNAEDVRHVNAKFFYFQEIMDEIEEENYKKTEEKNDENVEGGDNKKDKENKENIKNQDENYCLKNVINNEKSNNLSINGAKNNKIDNELS